CANPNCGVANPPGVRDCQRCGSPMPLPVGTMILGHYKVDKLLKMGGFGAVYRAVDTKNGNREAAIKDIIRSHPPEVATHPNLLRREAELLKMLDKVPIVPKVYDYAEEGQRAHLVMEFIRGKDRLDLREQNKKNPSPIDVCTQWGTSICDVLPHIHNQQPP